MSYLYLIDRNEEVVEQRAGHAPPHLVKWGIRETDHRVIFANRGTEPPVRGSRFSQYDGNHNLRSRVRFEAALAAYVLTDCESVMPAIRVVNAGLKSYLDTMGRVSGDQGGFHEYLGGTISNALYMDWFGRVAPSDSAPRTGAEVTATLLSIVEQPQRYALQQVMNVHQTFAWKIVRTFGFARDDQQQLWDQWSRRLLTESGRFDRRPRQARDPDTRGRPAREGPPTTNVGYVAPGDTQVATFAESHPRAVDEWTRQNDIWDFIDRGGAPVPFVAAISGSTVDLVRVAKVFGNLEGDLMKQYMLACVAYLVGGGHHSFHEVMEVGRLAGVRYEDGQYDAQLPDRFRESAWYDCLMQDFPDVLFCEYWPEVDSFIRPT